LWGIYARLNIERCKIKNVAWDGAEIEADGVRFFDVWPEV